MSKILYVHDFQSINDCYSWSIARWLDQDPDWKQKCISQLSLRDPRVSLPTVFPRDRKSETRLLQIMRGLSNLTQGVFGMNIREINNATPKWSSVLAFGLPLAAVTVMMPLSFGYSYRKVSVFISRNQKFSRRFIIFGGPVLGVSSIIVAVILSAVIVKQKWEDSITLSTDSVRYFEDLDISRKNASYSINTEEVLFHRIIIQKDIPYIETAIWSHRPTWRIIYLYTHFIQRHGSMSCYSGVRKQHSTRPP